jgi:hypothetical protein
MRVALVMLSLGERPWLPIAGFWMERYCRRCGYDFIFVDKPLLRGLMPGNFDRFQTYGRVQKLGIGRLFNAYDRVIQIDDSCLIAPDTPPLAEIVPPDAIGCLVEGRHLPAERFAQYAAVHQRIYGRQSPLPPERFFNSGVAIYSKRHAPLFDAATIPWDKVRADTQFPTQGYLGDRAETAGFPLFDLGPNYNFLGSMMASMGDIARIPDTVFVFHLTSLLNERLSLAEALHQRFLQRFPTEG